MIGKTTKNLQNVDEVIGEIAYTYNSSNENICNMYNENGIVIADDKNSYVIKSKNMLTWM